MNASFLRPAPRLRLVVAIVAASAAIPVWAQEGDTDRGRLLYENHCHTCHVSEAHVRSNRKAKTKADLRGWVRRWQGVLELGWGKAEVEDVAAWLYQRYYEPALAPATPAPAPEKSSTSPPSG